MKDGIVIKATDIVKVYGKGESAFKALHGVSLQVQRGESLAIVGKSGSGKSTLTHILATLDQPTSGKLEINGQDTKKLSAKKINKLRNQEIGFVFQQFFMNPHESVIENVMLPLKIAGVKPSERRKRAMDALKIVELDSKAHAKATDLSGGQKQRVCIARAIVNNPSIIFADEPTGNLDSATGYIVEKLLFNLNKRKHITLIIVTHDIDLAAKCDRQLHLKDGRLVSDEEDKSNDYGHMLAKENK